MFKASTALSTEKLSCHVVGCQLTRWWCPKPLASRSPTACDRYLWRVQAWGWCFTCRRSLPSSAWELCLLSLPGACSWAERLYCIKSYYIVTALQRKTDHVFQVRATSKNVQDALAGATQVAEERISNIRTVRAFATENREIAAYDQQMNNVLDKAKVEALAQAKFYGMVRQKTIHKHIT